ncbi:MAG: phosphate signaling complex protein PhoU [Gammaproteobacteria bacterium]
MEQHTVKRYDEELHTLQSLVLKMGGLVQEQIEGAIKALDDEDLDGARRVVAGDQMVNGYNVQVDETAVHLIARRQPVASDLRLIVSLEKAVNDLERIGDEAAKIAQMVLRIYDSDSNAPNHGLLRDVPPMARLAVGLLTGALDALARMDISKALEVARRDAELDEAFGAGIRHLTTYVMEDPRNMGHAINTVLILKALERMGDHSKNIAEYVVYYVKGTDIRSLEAKDLKGVEASSE